MLLSVRAILNYIFLFILSEFHFTRAFWYFLARQKVHNQFFYSGKYISSRIDIFILDKFGINE